MRPILLQCTCDQPHTETTSFPFMPHTGMGGAMDTVIVATSISLAFLLLVALLFVGGLVLFRMTTVEQE